MRTWRRGDIAPENKAESPSWPPLLALTVDIVILTIRHDVLHVLLIERSSDPYRGQLALPGGFVDQGEDLNAAAARELYEETGIGGAALHLEQLRTYATPRRDPRGRVATVAFLAVAPNLPSPMAGSDAAAAHWLPVDRPHMLAFDHRLILDDAVERARTKIEYSPLATAFCPAEFTIGELRAVYEAVWDLSLDPRNFYRNITSVDGFVMPVGRRRQPPTGRSAELYKRGEAAVLHPAMLRPATRETAIRSLPRMS